MKEIGGNIGGNPDIKNVIKCIENDYQIYKEDSRFIIFVKTRTTAKALAERLPGYLRSTHLTGYRKSVQEGGNHLFDMGTTKNQNAQNFINLYRNVYHVYWHVQS